MVVWRADLYQKEALRQLSDTSFYAKVDKDLTSTNQQIVKSTINDLIVKQELPATASNLIITTPRTSCICFLPKIHKPNNPGRPIVSACSCPTELISSYLDKIMAPIVRSLPSYVKDSQHALQIFRDFNFLGEDKLIFTMDITSLYTVIPNGEGLLALKHFFDLRTVQEPSSETLLRNKFTKPLIRTQPVEGSRCSWPERFSHPSRCQVRETSLFVFSKLIKPLEENTQNSI